MENQVCKCGQNPSCECSPVQETPAEPCCTPAGQVKRYHRCIGCDQKPVADASPVPSIEPAAERLYTAAELMYAYSEGAFAIMRYRNGQEWVGNSAWFAEYTKQRPNDNEPSA